jgi:hypothetical protein
MIKYDKRELTKAVYDHMLDHSKQGVDDTLDNLVFKWWVTGRSGSGFQLTYLGMMAFQLVEFQYYQFDLTEPTQTFIMKLNRRLPCPYYMNSKAVKPYIRVYDNKVAMMITLFGTVEEYINSLENYSK